MKVISAGILAGMVAGFLYPSMQYLISFLASGGRLTFMYEAMLFSQLPWARQLGLTIEMVLVIMFVGFVFFTGACVGLGAVLGAAFVKFSHVWTIRSVYPWALVIGLGIYGVYFLFQFATTHMFLDIYILITMIIDSLIFSALFLRWTKRSGLSH